MTALKKILLLILFTLILSSCEAIDDFGLLNNRSESPIALQGITFDGETYSLNSADTLCIYIDEAKIWELGDFWITNDDAPQAEIYIDSMLISDLTVNRSLILSVLLDENGEEIGAYSGGYTLCPLDLNLSEGTHNLRVIITSTSGVDYSLELDFEVVTNDE